MQSGREGHIRVLKFVEWDEGQVGVYIAHFAISIRELY